jgi:hypothetical protein
MRAVSGPAMIGGMGSSDPLCLPVPTGPCPVGTTSLLLKDTSCPDPWAAGVNAQELMVSLWYPAGQAGEGSGGRAADVSFVLDQLTGTHPAGQGAGLIDPSRMAMADHSIGGAASIAAMLFDSRILAGIDMDGSTQVTADVPAVATAPGAAYYLLTAGGIIVSLGIIAATFPLLARITGPEVAGNE